MIIDLHLHTTCSDGTATPTETVKTAITSGIDVISICDHNTILAYSELAFLPSELPIRIITGTEIDSTWQNRNLHILAYDFNLEDRILLQLLEENKRKLEQMSTDLILKMEKDYPNIHISEYKHFQRNASHGGWKGIDYLRSKGFAGSYPECMNYYKNYGIPSAVYPSPEHVCKIIHAAGGKAVLAHPWCRLTREPESFIQELSILVKAGLDGIECEYPDHPPQVRDLLSSFCRDHKLFKTAGSDSHGEFAKCVNGIVYQIGLEKFELDDFELNMLLG